MNDTPTPNTAKEGKDTLIQRHHRLAAEARALLHNNGFGPNIQQQQQIDSILSEIAGIPPAGETGTATPETSMLARWIAPYVKHSSWEAAPGQRNPFVSMSYEQISSLIQQNINEIVEQRLTAARKERDELAKQVEELKEQAELDQTTAADNTMRYCAELASLRTQAEQDRQTIAELKKELADELDLHRECAEDQIGCFNEMVKRGIELESLRSQLALAKGSYESQRSAAVKCFDALKPDDLGKK